MIEFRLRILDVRESDLGRDSFLGIVEGVPQILIHSVSIEQAENALTNALIEHLKRLQDQEATLLELDDYPTVRMYRLCLMPPVT